MKLPPIPIASTVAAVHHRGHQHFAERLLNRRGFLEKTSLTLGALAGSGMLTGVSRAAVLNGAASINRGAKPQPRPRPYPYREDCSCSALLGHCSMCSCRRPELSPPRSRISMGSLDGPRSAAWAHTHRSGRHPRIFRSNRMSASCSASSSARTDGTTTEHLRSYDWTYTQVPLRTCKSMILIQG